MATELWFVGIMAYAILYTPTITHEEKILAELFGSEYTCYCRSVPRFIPKLHRLPAGSETCFSWHQVLENREYLNVAAVLIAVLLVILQM